MSLPDDGISLCFVGSSSFICGIYNYLRILVSNTISISDGLGVI